MKHTWLLAVLSTFVVGCSYAPTFGDCAITCVQATDCPETYACGNEGLCREDGAAGSCAAIARPDADLSCSCSTSQTLSCSAGDTTCALGCVAKSGVAQCASYTPSNGATEDHLVGVTAALDVGPAVNASIDTTTGAIVFGTSTVVRAAGIGVVGGIGFYPIDDTLAVLAVTGVSLKSGSRVRVQGSRALLVWSGGDVEIAGVIDASAGCADGKKSCPGPGGAAGSTTVAQATGCGAGKNGPPGPDFLASGGGGGYGRPGGSTITCFGVTGIAGASCGSPTLVPLIGGFGGGRGGVRSGGGGGGAIQISSKTKIQITSGGIDAGGAGGTGKPFGDSGEAGGAGSGGAILLEAPAVSLAAGAILAANGGGGGGNCEGFGAGEPHDGEDGRFDTTQALPGGCANSVGGGTGFGGKGGAGTAAAGSPTECNGGGGGGVGRIRINTLPTGIQTQGAKVSPEASFGFVSAS